LISHDETARRQRIARIKVTHYLLKLRDEDDKSKFLSLAGYTLAHADQWQEALRGLLKGEAEFIKATEYGEKYRIRGNLRGPNGKELPVVSVSMTEGATGLTKFVTLYPDKDEI